MKRFRSISLDPINTLAWTGILVLSVLFAFGIITILF